MAFVGSKRGVSGYNNEILVSNGLVLGKNKVVNLPVKIKSNSHHLTNSLPHETKAKKLKANSITSDNKQRRSSPPPPLTYKDKQQHEKITRAAPLQAASHSITHEEEKIALVIAIVCVFTAWRLLLL